MEIKCETQVNDIEVGPCTTKMQTEPCCTERALMGSAKEPSEKSEKSNKQVKLAITPTRVNSEKSVFERKIPRSPSQSISITPVREKSKFFHEHLRM